METHGLNILVDPKEIGRNRRPNYGEDLLVRWIMERVIEWERHRNTNYLKRWDEYYRIWRTEWNEEDRNRDVERSRIMPTDLAEAVERQTAELADAFFARDVWMDMADDAEDINKDDVRQMALKLREDADHNGVRPEGQKAIFNAALYGTGILKLPVTQKQVPKATRIVDEFGQEVMGGVTLETVVALGAVAVSPREFVIDPAARTVDEALGCAHILNVPRHSVLQGQRAGIYAAGKVPEWTGQMHDPYTTELRGSASGMVRLVEYHGLVPAGLMPGRRVREGLRRKIVDNQLDSEVEMVEVIVLIANDQMRLKAVDNPFIPQDRGVIAFQYMTVPDAFWGRGVIESAYHPYKALQTEIRARSDGLALANYPTMWRDEASLTGDQTREDADEKIIEPGKEYLVSGNPNEVLREFKFSGPDRGTSEAIADYQRMIESATATFGFQSASMTSKHTGVQQAPIALQTFLRRNKGIASNVERGLMQPMITKLAWRSMQFKPRRFPPTDFKFKARGAMGILERDAERSNLVELLQAIPPESPAFFAIVRLIVESGPYEQHQQIMAILDGLIAAALNPPPPPRDLGGEARLLSAQHRVKEHEDEMALEGEKLKRADVELMIKSKSVDNGGNSIEGGQAPAMPGAITLNLQPANKRVTIRRTETGELVGETEEIGNAD